MLGLEMFKSQKIILPQEIILPLFQQGDFTSRTSKDFEDYELNFKIIELEFIRPLKLLSGECIFFETPRKTKIKRAIVNNENYPFLFISIVKINGKNVFRVKNIGNAMVNLYRDKEIGELI